MNAPECSPFRDAARLPGLSSAVIRWLYCRASWPHEHDDALSHPLPDFVREELLAAQARLNRPRIKTSDAQLAAIVDGCGCRPTYRRHVHSTLRHAVKAGDDIRANLAQLRRNRPDYWR